MKTTSELPLTLRRPGVGAYACEFSGFEKDFAEIMLPDSMHAAVPKRQNEFRAGRHCAWYAIQALGVRPAFPEIGPACEPVWPAGLVGSISHTRGYAIAIAASNRSYAGLGIDVEGFLSTSKVSSLYRQVTTEAELNSLCTCFDLSQAFALLFSGKEAIYKAIYPQVRRFVGFHEVELTKIEETRLIFHPSDGLASSLGSAEALCVSFALSSERVLTLSSIERRDRYQSGMFSDT